MSVSALVARRQIELVEAAADAADVGQHDTALTMHDGAQVASVAGDVLCLVEQGERASTRRADRVIVKDIPIRARTRSVRAPGSGITPAAAS